MRSHPVVLESGESFVAREDETLLAAADRSAIELVSSCRNGTCRTCMRRLRAGTVDYRGVWPGLSPEERAAGWILPCIAHATSALVLGEAAQRAWWE